MIHEDFIKLCSRKVAEFENNRVDIDVKIDRDDVFCVWSCKTLQNSKCLISAKHKGTYYYEFTYNGDKGEVYMDVYKKLVNKALDLDGKEITEKIK